MAKPNLERTHAASSFLSATAGRSAIKEMTLLERNRTGSRRLIVRYVIPFVSCVVGAAVLAVFLRGRNPSGELAQGTQIDRILVQKSVRELSVFRKGQLLKTYHVALGENPVGAKEQEGDMKTPEGLYTIDYRNPKSDFHLALHISYPSPADVERAKARGVSAGFDIMIHGLPNGMGWMGQSHRLKDLDSRMHRPNGSRNRGVVANHSGRHTGGDSAVTAAALPNCRPGSNLRWCDSLSPGC